MSVWRYTAIDLRMAQSSQGSGDPKPVPRTGELAGTTAAEVRSSLRRIGLQVIDLRQIKSGRQRHSQAAILESLRDSLHNHLRNRRKSQRAEFYDSLATMLSAGVPLLEAVQTMVESRQSTSSRKNRAGNRGMLVQLREQLRSGQSLSSAMVQHPSWFDTTEIAMVSAAEHGGTLPAVLLTLAERHQRSGELSHKLVSALAYPSVVLVVGLGVVVFLSVKTLPDLVKVLTDSKIATPPLTAKVMWFGQFVAGHWLVLACAMMGLALAAAILPRIVRQRQWIVPLPTWLKRLFQAPAIVRTVAVGGVAQRLAELIRSGVPMVEAFRVLAPTTRSAHLQRLLVEAAQRIERGDELSQALDDQQWFNAEFRRLLDIGQASGELDSMLDRIGQRYQRQARRLIDRLTAILEPAVILVLAGLVGIVVMAAILPLLRLQEII